MIPIKVITILTFEVNMFQMNFKIQIGRNFYYNFQVTIHFGHFVSCVVFWLVCNDSLEV